jgi:beta-xylosidase
MAPACSSEQGADDEYSDTAWSNLTAVDTGDAVLEDADSAPTEDVTTDEVVDTDDPPSADDDDDFTPEPDAFADLGPGHVPGEGVSPRDVASAPRYQNAVFANCADPGVVHAGNTFFATCTGGGYPRYSSPDLVHWTSAGYIFSTATRPRWASGNFWAPEIHPIGSGYIAYFAALSGTRGKMCIGAAHATRPGGPFTDIGRPLVCSRHVGLIDPNVLTVGHRHFLYYKTDGNSLTPKERTVIYAQELGANGVKFVGKRRALIKNNLGWEGDVVEAPWVHAHGGHYYMFYSGFTFCNATYAVGVARADSPLGPFKKRGAPILRTNPEWNGPGHNAIASAGGHDYIVYHAWKGAHTCAESGDRELMLDRVRWVGGWPRVNNGTPSRGPQPVP